MASLKCPNCGKKLSAAEEFSGKLVQCPKCRNRIRVPELTTNEPGEPHAASPVTAKSQPSSQNYPEPAAPSVSNANGSQPTSFVALSFAFFDFRFDKYLTPWIIRFTWVCVLLLAGLWLLYLGGGAIASSFSKPEKQAPALGDADLLELLSGGGLGALTGQKRDRSWLEKTVSGTVWYVTGLVTIVLSVLWMRVGLEVLIVIFNISKTLKSIEKKVERR